MEPVSSRHIQMSIDLLDAMVGKPGPNGQPALSGDEAIAALDRYFSAYPNYVSSVIECETAAPIVQANCEGEDIRGYQHDLDERCNKACNEAIRSTCILNGLAKHYGVESTLPDIGANPEAAINDPKVRSLVANFAKEYCFDIYMHRDGR